MICIAKPPDGLFITDAVRYATYKLYFNMGGEPIKLIEFSSKLVLRFNDPVDKQSIQDIFFNAYRNLINEALERAKKRKTDVPLTSNDKKSIINFIKNFGFQQSFRGAVDYLEWYLAKLIYNCNIGHILNELRSAKYTAKNIVQLGGDNISCPNILKLNYYKFRRGLCSPIMAADLRVGIHYLTYALVGALLSKAGNKITRGEGRLERYGYYSFPDSYDGLEMAELVANSIREVWFQRSPDELFHFYMAIRIQSPRSLLEEYGRIPNVKLYIVKEPGNRADLYAVLFFGSGDTGILSSKLGGVARKALIRLLRYVLINWDRRDKLKEKDAILLDYIYNICKNLYLVEAGVFSYEEAVPILYRQFYIPISQDDQLRSNFINKFHMDVENYKNILIRGILI